MILLEKKSDDREGENEICELVSEKECPLMKRVYRKSMRIEVPEGELWCADLTCPCRVSNVLRLQKTMDQY